jgi:hypothetical protein
MLFYIRYLNFMTRLTQWEYWPFEVIYLPIFVYWLWLSVKARSLFFFSAANPSIENGGMLGESKLRFSTGSPLPQTRHRAGLSGHRTHSLAGKPAPARDSASRSLPSPTWANGAGRWKNCTTRPNWPPTTRP